MHRSRIALGFLLAPILFVMIVSTIGCGGSSEEPLVRRFFSASRSRDNVTLGSCATVSFDPATNGTVENPSFVSETPETTTPLDLKAKAQTVREAQAAEKAFGTKMKEYQDANADAIKRVLDAEGANKKLGGKDAAIQQAWSKWREDGKAEQKKVSEAKVALNAQRPVVELSMQNPARPIEVTDYEGVLATKDMTVSANVKMPSGETVKKTLVITLQQARLKGEGGADIVGRWVITKVKEAEAK